MVFLKKRRPSGPSKYLVILSYRFIALSFVLSVTSLSNTRGANSQSMLDEVVVSASRSEQRAFDAPAAINSVGIETISVAGPQVNLSEALSRIPGVSASNRNNYAQDPQISIRGFGARAAFGVRGIKLLTDGIPASIPDGQGQASSFALTSTDRIEVLRGPLAVLYGNSSGGVVQAFTRKASELPEVSLSGYAGAYGLKRGDLQFSTTMQNAGLLGDYSHFETDGFRVNSAAKRTQFNGKYDLKHAEQTQISFILNIWDQPYALDPAGLTAEQMASDREQAGTNTVERRVRKITSQEQLGGTIRHQDSFGRIWEGRVYMGQRQNLQYQASDQWVGLNRDFYGFGLSGSETRNVASIPVRITGGIELDYSKERRQAGLASGGEKVSGSLTRNEDNIAKSVNGYVMGIFLPSDLYTITAGARIGRVDFESNDLFITANDPDGSGKIRYSQFGPAIGLTRHVSSSTSLFLNYGRGFETPTLAEVAYERNTAGNLPSGTFNQSIRASKSDQAELGIKWRPNTRQSLSAVLFWVGSTDEIVTDQSASGRSSFKNAPKTKRLGAEISWLRDWSSQWRSILAASLIDATYQTDFDAGTNPIASGNRIPGIPSYTVFAEVEWAQSRNKRSIAQGWSAGIELQAVGRRYANDINTLSADPFETIAIRSGLSQTVGLTDFQLFARLDNLLDEDFVGSVIVNAFGSRVFEPSPGRNWMVGLKSVTRF
jgi:iron complex outermembrane recepter protein